ncbi:hypothetical protein BN7_5309 [Wickerhamomyces ciferrii]|uniref:Uncharacterized protein n=1 Tax=Wickerhamomyces ciferrii (strain ATCC 14091 / BCRC 22168 / CBS 111 / JCM 3599 / NBRC 0793 / NRRL Y-1031 F-60-10) TaxID=1206466 RepID=K0KXC2_WICCF|nr:uncharacterized protein BN7_5309 [Wickerhamomyces ciferrii]CCH45723.1 hypothetical protein BN7_5309 [Wickerhamomyces ciferrii]
MSTPAKKPKVEDDDKPKIEDAEFVSREEYMRKMKKQIEERGWLELRIDTITSDLLEYKQLYLAKKDELELMKYSHCCKKYVPGKLIAELQESYKELSEKYNKTVNVSESRFVETQKHKANFTSLQNRFSEGKREINTVKEVNGKLSKENEALKKELEELKNLKEPKEKLPPIDHNNIRIASSDTIYQTPRELLLRQIDELNSKIEVQDLVIGRLEDERDTLREQLNQKVNDRPQSPNLRALVEKEFNQILSQKELKSIASEKQLKLEITELKKQLAKERKDNEFRSLKIEDLQGIKDDLTGSIKDAEEKDKNQSDKINKLEKELEILKKSKIESGENVTINQARLKKWETDYRELHDQLTKLSKDQENKMKAKDLEISKLTNNNKTAQTIMRDEWVQNSMTASQIFKNLKMR